MRQYVASVIRSRRGDGPKVTVKAPHGRLDPAVVAQLEKLAGRRQQPQPEPSPPLEAALATLAWYHARLLDLRPGPIERELAYDLTWRRDWALFALSQHGTGGWAKEQQVEITGGKPLAICTGSAGGWPVETVELGTLWAGTTGCFRIWEEPTRLSGRKWGRLCPDCQPSGGHRNPYRDAWRPLRKRVRRYLDDRIGTP